MAKGVITLLESMKVLSFTHFLQGPLAAQTLGDFGADVIKIEPLTGAFERHWSGHNAYLNGISINFLIGNRNNRSISVDLKTIQGKEIVSRLVQDADVLIENYRPGVMQRLGLDYESLRKINPSLIYCSCSGYGEDGPYCMLPGQDILAQAKSGLMMQSGRKTDPPIPLGAPVVDIHGSVLAASAILAAYYARLRTGQGRKIESNLLDAALDLQIEPLNIHLNGFPLYDRSPSGISSRFGQAPYGIFQTADSFLCLSMIPLDKLAIIFDDEIFLTWTDDGQFVRREEINQRVAEHMITRTNEEWIQIFDQNQVWYSLVCTYEDVQKNPQVQWNQIFYEIDHPAAGKVRLMANPIRFNGKCLKQHRMPPTLGEHTVEILSEIGYCNDEIQQLIQEHIINAGNTSPE